MSSFFKSCAGFQITFLRGCPGQNVVERGDVEGRVDFRSMCCKTTAERIRTWGEQHSTKKTEPEQRKQKILGAVDVLSITSTSGLEILQPGAFRIKPRAVAGQGSDLPRLHL